MVMIRSTTQTSKMIFTMPDLN